MRRAILLGASFASLIATVSCQALLGLEEGEAKGGEGGRGSSNDCETAREKIADKLDACGFPKGKPGVCDPTRTPCLAECVDEASCGALDGKDARAVAELAACSKACLPSEEEACGVVGVVEHVSGCALAKTDCATRCSTKAVSLAAAVDVRGSCSAAPASSCVGDCTNKECNCEVGTCFDVCVEVADLDELLDNETFGCSNGDGECIAAVVGAIFSSCAAACEDSGSTCGEVCKAACEGACTLVENLECLKPEIAQDTDEMRKRCSDVCGGEGALFCGEYFYDAPSPVDCLLLIETAD